MKHQSVATEGLACCGLRNGMETTVDVLTITSLCRLMGDANRLRILACHRAGERCVQDICFAMGLHQNLVSHHLCVLREAGLVKTRREGHRVCYSVNKTLLAAVYPALENAFNPGRVCI